MRVLEYLDASRLVAPRGIVIAEHHWRAELPERFDRLERTRQLEQGDAVLSFYRPGSRRLNSAHPSSKVIMDERMQSLTKLETSPATD